MEPVNLPKMELEWIMCSECLEDIPFGVDYIMRLEGFDEDSPVMEIVCLRCGLGEP